MIRPEEQGALGLTSAWTPDLVAQRVPDQWAAGAGLRVPADEEWRGFLDALAAAVNAGMVDVRTVITARHGKTGERRTFASTDTDFPGYGAFNIEGSAYTTKRPWYHLGSHREWRRVTMAAA